MRSAASLCQPLTFPNVLSLKASEIVTKPKMWIKQLPVFTDRPTCTRCNRPLPSFSGRCYADVGSETIALPRVHFCAGQYVSLRQRGKYQTRERCGDIALCWRFKSRHETTTQIMKTTARLQKASEFSTRSLLNYYTKTPYFPGHFTEIVMYSIRESMSTYCAKLGNIQVHYFWSDDRSWQTMTGKASLCTAVDVTILFRNIQ